MPYKDKSKHRENCKQSYYANRERRIAFAKRIRESNPERCIWYDLVKRCTNPKNRDYPRYGGRGITLCPEWLVFETFLSDMGPRPSSQHSVERIDNELGYSKSNCRWATKHEQVRNTRRNKWLTANGVTMVQSDWANKISVHPTVIYNRLKSGWSVEDAVTKRVNHVNR